MRFGPPPEDHRLLAVARLRLILGQVLRAVIGRIEIGRPRIELGGAGVDALEHRVDAQRFAPTRDLGFGKPRQRREARVRKALLFQPAQNLARRRGDRPRAPSPRRRRERRSGAGTRGRSGTPRALPRRSRPRGTPGRRRADDPESGGSAPRARRPCRRPSGSRGSPPRRGRTSLSRSNTAPFAAIPRRSARLAIASPTDFIDVVSVASAPGNFSKVKRGILVTT